MSSVLDLINAIEAGKTRECESAFESLIHAKIAEKMEERRAEIRANMFESTELGEEQLDELSKSTLGSYVKKATQDVQKLGFRAGTKISRDDEEGAKAAIDASKSRRKGVDKALSRLTKESEDLDEEQIDEVGTLTSLAIGHAISGNNMDHNKISAHRNMQKAAHYAQYTGKKPEIPTTLKAKPSAGSMIAKAKGM